MSMKPAVISIDPTQVPPDGFIICISDVRLDGAPFPWPTIDAWRIVIGDDLIAYLEVKIAVTFEPTPYAEVSDATAH